MKTLTAPGLIEQPADFHIDLGRSIFIGDSATDVQAAQALGYSESSSAPT